MSTIKRPPILKMAPPGFHVVERQAKISKNGVKYFVKTHLRKNKNKKLFLLPENILYIFWHADHEYTKLGGVKGYPEYEELDSVIFFWFNYWKEAGFAFPKDFDPFIIKVIIAIESSFNPKAKSPVSTATGLMQLLNSTLNRLKGIPVNQHQEVKEHFLMLMSEDITDPVINIAAGVRWLAHKYYLLEKKSELKEKNTYSLIKYYHQWTKDGDDYAAKVLNLYINSRHI